MENRNALHSKSSTLCVVFTVKTAARARIFKVSAWLFHLIWPESRYKWDVHEFAVVIPSLQREDSVGV